MKTKNLLEKSIKTLKTEVFEDIIKNDNFKLERIISNGYITPEGEWYNQENNEWVSLLQGQATIEFENNKTVELKAFDHITILAHHKHRVTYTSKDAIWLTLHYTNQDKTNKISS